MRRAMLSAATWLVLAGVALAAPAPPPGAAPPRPPPRLFLSPAGEPFHATADAPDPLKTWFDQADAGHLGYLDRAEFRADAARFFKRLDENGDGIVDGFEVADYEHKLVPELTAWSEGLPVGDGNGAPGTPGGRDRRGGLPGGRRDGDGSPRGDAGRGDGGHGPRGRQAPLAQLINDPEPVMAADFAFDGHITLAEWMRVTDARFDALDAAHAGRLTLDALRLRLSHSAQPAPPRHTPEPPDTSPGQPPQATL